MKTRLHTYYISSIALLLVLVSCSQTEDELLVNQTAIGIDIQETQTRSIIEKADSIRSLGIFAYNTGTIGYDTQNTAHIPNLIYNYEAIRTLDNEVLSPWTYSPNAYWPIDLAVKNTFFAYSPHSSKFPIEANIVLSRSTDSDYPTLTYTVPSEGSKQVDILYSDFSTATYDLNRDINRNTHSGKVKYAMKHATAWIAFLIAPIKTASDLESYTIKSLQFSAINFINRAQFDLGRGTWTGIHSSTVTYNLPLNPNPVEVGKIEWATPSDYRLMVIPQPIKRDVNDTMINMSYTFFNGSTQDEDEYSYSIPFPETTFAIGRVTNYVLNISVDGISIEFAGDNSIEEWLEGGGAVIDVY